MIQKICLLGLGLTLCLSLCLSSLEAQTIVGSIEDTTLRSIAAGAEGDEGVEEGDVVFGRTNRRGNFIFAGRFTTVAGDPANGVALYRFALPDLGAVANPFTTANFEFSYLSSVTLNEVLTDNLDLYGIGAREMEDQVLGNDFFVGPGPDTREAVVTLQEDILMPDSEIGRINSVDIADYLNTLYDGGNGIGLFAVFRLSPDFADTSLIVENTDRYNLGAANNPDVTLQPIINFTTASILLGDVNLDGTVNFLDITPFIAFVASDDFLAEADIDGNGVVNFLDITPFIAILTAP